jgi:hypothetical protein
MTFSFNTPPDITEVVKSRMRSSEHVADMVEIRMRKQFWYGSLKENGYLEL